MIPKCWDYRMGKLIPFGKTFLTFLLLQLQGFIVGDADFGPKYYQEHQEKVSKWLADKELIYRESITDGIDNAINGLLGLFHGRNFGKAVLKVPQASSLPSHPRSHVTKHEVQK